jgi:N-acetylneuraminate synthase
MVELHCSLDRALPGTDQSSSLERHGLELVCRELKRIPNLIGDGVKKLYDSELPARKKLRGT